MPVPVHARRELGYLRRNTRSGCCQMPKMQEEAMCLSVDFRLWFDHLRAAVAPSI